MTRTRKAIAAAVVGCTLSATTAALSPPAHAGPIRWCDPSSPLFDPTICHNEEPGGGYSCDPTGPAYDANYCAAQGRSR
jgi:hypothetical protein